MSKTTRAALLWLVPALLLMTLLTVRGLDADLIWIDELMSIGNTGGLRKIPFNPLEVIDSLRIQSPQHVPGYFFLLSGWAGLTGWHPAILRVPSLFFGLLAVAFTYRLGRDHLSPQAGLFGALLMAVSAMLVHYSHELRMYSMIPALTALVMWLYLRIMWRDKPPSRLAWIAFALSGISLIYTHYYATLPLAAIGMYHLLVNSPFAMRSGGMRVSSRRWWNMLAMLILIALSFAPWLPVVVVGFADATEGRSDLRADALPPLQVPLALATLFGDGAAWLVVVAVVLTALAFRYDRRRVWLLAVLLLGLLIAANLAIGMITERRTRYLISLWPLLAVLCGLGLSQIERRWRYAGRVLLLVWVVTGIGASLDSGFLAHIDGPRHVERYPPLREMVAALDHRAGDNDLIVAFARTADIYTLYKINTIGEYYLGDLDVDYNFIGIDDWRAPSPDEQKQTLRQQMANRLHLWLAYEPDRVPAETVREYTAILDEQYQPCATLVDDTHLRIQRYDQRDTGCLPDVPPETHIAQFGGIALADVMLLPGDESLRVVARWSIDDSVPPETYSVSFKVRDGDGNYLAQADYGLRDVGFGWQMGVIPTADLAEDGDYELTATIYNWRSGETVEGVLAATGETGDILPVAILVPGRDNVQAG